MLLLLMILTRGGANAIVNIGDMRRTMINADPANGHDNDRAIENSLCIASRAVHGHGGGQMDWCDGCWTRMAAAASNSR